MSLAHILSQESQLSQYYEEEKEKIERKNILAKSKEPVDLSIIEKGLQNLGYSSNGAHFTYLKLDLAGHDLLSLIVFFYFKEYLINTISKREWISLNICKILMFRAISYRH